MTKRRLRTLLALLALGMAIAGAAAFVYMRPLPVEVARPERNVPIAVFGLGTIEARIIARVGFEAGAALVELNADHGDRVRRGDVLARLNSAEQEARVAQARAGMLNADASVKAADAAVGKARAILAQKTLANKRKQVLVARNAASKEAAEEAQMENDVAVAELAVAVGEADVARAAREDARARYDLERVLLDHHSLKAPFDAVVVERLEELGTVLSPSDPLFTLVAPETVWVLAHVDEGRAGGIRVGQSAEVHLRSLPGAVFPGHVARIAIESDRVSEERRVYIACDRCPESFHLGEQAEVFITTATLDEAVLVPETVVQAFDGVGGTVWTVEDGALHRRKIRFGHRTLDSRLEIVAGLPKGAHVVTVSRPDLREGRAARIVEKERGP